MSIKVSDVFIREEIKYAEGVLVEDAITGVRFLFGRAEYSCNWLYTVWCERGNHMGSFNAGQLSVVISDDSNQSLIASQAETIANQQEKIELLQSELGSLISACERNTGHEPSLSVYQFTLDFARKALASTKPKPFDSDALINSLIERTGGEV